MKTRQGFVSNSSTSSFAVIGINGRYSHRELAWKIAKAEGYMSFRDIDNAIKPLRKEMGCKLTCPKCKAFLTYNDLVKCCSFCGANIAENFQTVKSLLAQILQLEQKSVIHLGRVVKFYCISNDDDAIGYVGIDIEDILDQFTIPEAIEQFCTIVKQTLDVDVPVEAVSLYIDVEYDE